MRSDYLPATAVCCVCRHLVREDQINGCIEGTITHRDRGTIKVDPFVGYLCTDCKKVMKETIEGGIPAAERREKEWKKDELKLGKLDPTCGSKDRFEGNDT